VNYGKSEISYILIIFIYEADNVSIINRGAKKVAYRGERERETRRERERERVIKRDVYLNNVYLSEIYKYLYTFFHSFKKNNCQTYKKKCVFGKQKHAIQNTFFITAVWK